MVGHAGNILLKIIARRLSEYCGRMEGRESPGTDEAGIEMGRKTREGGQGERVTSNRSRNTRRLNETVASCRGPEGRDGRRKRGKEE